MNEAERCMRLALEEAKRALAGDEVPVGAVLVRRGEVIAAAHNRVEGLTDATAHAELIALREGMAKLRTKRLDDCTLYVTLEPCAMCAGAAVNAKLGRLVFGAHEPKTGCCGSVYDMTDGMFLYTVEACGGVLEEECAALMAEYFVEKRKKDAK